MNCPKIKIWAKTVYPENKSYMIKNMYNFEIHKPRF